MTFQIFLKRVAIGAALVCMLGIALACVRYGAHKLSSARHRNGSRPEYAAVGGLGPERLQLGRRPEHTARILLDRPALERLHEAAKAQTPAFRNVVARCDEALARPVDSGYQGFE